MIAIALAYAGTTTRGIFYKICAGVFAQAEGKILGVGVDLASNLQKENHRCARRRASARAIQINMADLLGALCVSD